MLIRRGRHTGAAAVYLERHEHSTATDLPRSSSIAATAAGEPHTLVLLTGDHWAHVRALQAMLQLGSTPM